MRSLVQRVKSASVSIEGAVQGEIGAGLLVLLGIAETDTSEDLEYLARKIPALRIFADEAGKMNLSVVDAGGALLVVSQFTLIAETAKGNRPSFIGAARPARAIPVYEEFLTRMRATGLKVECGVFGADMQVALVNDGPVTILLDSREGR
ncbi:MAG: D-aminoacyl-tRNA deacylase [Bacteriovoracia bacterium]